MQNICEEGGAMCNLKDKDLFRVDEVADYFDVQPKGN